MSSSIRIPMGNIKKEIKSYLKRYLAIPDNLENVEIDYENEIYSIYPPYDFDFKYINALIRLLEDEEIEHETIQGGGMNGVGLSRDQLKDLHASLSLKYPPYNSDESNPESKTDSVESHNSSYIGAIEETKKYLTEHLEVFQDGRDIIRIEFNEKKETCTIILGTSFFRESYESELIKLLSESRIKFEEKNVGFELSESEFKKLYDSLYDKYSDVTRTMPNSTFLLPEKDFTMPKIQSSEKWLEEKEDGGKKPLSFTPGSDNNSGTTDTSNNEEKGDGGKKPLSFTPDSDNNSETTDPSDNEEKENGGKKPLSFTPGSDNNSGTTDTSNNVENEGEEDGFPSPYWSGEKGDGKVEVASSIPDSDNNSGSTDTSNNEENEGEEYGFSDPYCFGGKDSEDSSGPAPSFNSEKISNRNIERERERERIQEKKCQQQAKVKRFVREHFNLHGVPSDGGCLIWAIGLSLGELQKAKRNVTEEGYRSIKFGAGNTVLGLQVPALEAPFKYADYQTKVRTTIEDCLLDKSKNVTVEGLGAGIYVREINDLGNNDNWLSSVSIIALSSILNRPILVISNDGIVTNKPEVEGYMLNVQYDKYCQDQQSDVVLSIEKYQSHIEVEYGSIVNAYLQMVDLPNPIFIHHNSSWISLGTHFQTYIPDQTGNQNEYMRYLMCQGVEERKDEKQLDETKRQEGEPEEEDEEKKNEELRTGQGGEEEVVEDSDNNYGPGSAFSLSGSEEEEEEAGLISADQYYGDRQEEEESHYSSNYSGPAPSFYSQETLNNEKTPILTNRQTRNQEEEEEKERQNSPTASSSDPDSGSLTSLSDSIETPISTEEVEELQGLPTKVEEVCRGKCSLYCFKINPIQEGKEEEEEEEEDTSERLESLGHNTLTKIRGI